MTDEELTGLKSAACSDCSLQHLWLTCTHGCSHANGCHEQLILLFGLMGKVVNGLAEALQDGEERGDDNT